MGFVVGGRGFLVIGKKDVSVKIFDSETLGMEPMVRDEALRSGLSASANGSMAPRNVRKILLPDGAFARANHHSVLLARLLA
jgi:hypothetical protein